MWEQESLQTCLVSHAALVHIPGTPTSLVQGCNLVPDASSLALTLPSTHAQSVPLRSPVPTLSGPDTQRHLSSPRISVRTSTQG